MAYVPAVIGKWFSERKMALIDYNPFWETLKESEESTYTLIVRHRMSSATIDKLRKNKPMNTTTLDHLCQILECTLDDIVRYVPDGGMASALSKRQGDEGYEG